MSIDDTVATIVLATYNGSEFIRQQLESLKAQNYPNIRVIISDDGSTDSTLDVVTSFIANYQLGKNWRIINHEGKGGYAENFTDALMLPEEGVLFLCDQDDVWHPEKVSRMMEVLSEHSEINVLASDLETFSTGANPLKWSKHDTATMNDSGEVESIGMRQRNLMCQRSGCTMCVRSDFFKSIHPYWILGWAHDDFLWKMGVLAGACAILHLKLMDRRLHEHNTTNVKIRTRQSRINQIKLLRSDAIRCNEFVQSFPSVENSDVEGMLNKLIRSTEIRVRMLSHRNIFLWFLLALEYSDCYPWRKALLLDMYLIFRNEYRGN